MCSVCGRFFFFSYPSILFAFCPFKPYHSQKALSKFSMTQKEGKTHERKCNNQSMSHRKSIKCLHHSHYTRTSIFCAFWLVVFRIHKRFGWIWAMYSHKKRNHSAWTVYVFHMIGSDGFCAKSTARGDEIISI